MNETGIVPVECKVLIRVDELEDKSSGGIFLPDSARSREQHGHDRGTLVEASEMAFGDWTGRIPKPGDKVIYDKYAGKLVQYSADKKRTRDDYRLCNDVDICAIIEGENDD